MTLKTARLSEGTTWRLSEKTDLSLVYHLKMENPPYINHSTRTCGFFSQSLSRPVVRFLSLRRSVAQSVGYLLPLRPVEMHLERSNPLIYISYQIS